MKIIIDAMGGDFAPGVPCDAAALAADSFDVDIVLVGKQDAIESELKKHKFDKSKITIRHAQEVVTNEEEPAWAVRHKKDSSISVAATMLKNGEGDALLSFGSTGALLAAGLLVIGRIKGILRPAIATLLPSESGPVLLLDAGANTNCKPENLVQFAKMGSNYMRDVMGYKNPKVGLVSNGEEEGKGDALTKQAYPVLKEAGLNFIGNIEGRDIMVGKAEVIVCDGFVGNVILKTVEGMGAVFSKALKGLFSEKLTSKLGALFVLGGIKKLKKRMDYREYGGAPLLGLSAPVIKGHGSSDTKAALSAIKQAKRFVETGFIAKLECELKGSN